MESKDKQRHLCTLELRGCAAQVSSSIMGIHLHLHAGTCTFDPVHVPAGASWG